MNILKQTGLVLFAATILTNTADAQKKQYTMAEATNGIYTTLAPEGIKSASWEPGTNKLYHVVKVNNEDAWVSVRFPDVVTDTVLRLFELNKQLDRSKNLNSLPTMHWISKGLVWMKLGEQLYQGVATGDGYMWSKWITVPKDAENLTVDKNQNVVYTVANNLYVIGRDKDTYSYQR